jgi:hypothetical protein
MDTKKKVLIGAGSAAALAGGFVAFRLYVRAETKKTLIEEYRFDLAFQLIEDAEAASGEDFNMPSYDEFVAALVPIWGITMPKEAISDVLKNGRNSEFWSDAHRTPVNRAVESKIFRALRAAQETPEDASVLDMLLAAGFALAQDEILART